MSDRNVRPSVTSDEGGGDEWPEIRRQILDASIFVLGTPIWMGHPSSHAQRVLERLDAFLGESDPDGRMVSLDKVAIWLSWATKTVRTTSRPNCFKDSVTSASPSQLRA